MSEMKNIPDANESWLQAEKMLDRHFMRRRIIKWMLVFLVPAAVALFTYMYFANPTIGPGEKTALNGSDIIRNANKNTGESGVKYSSDAEVNSKLNPSANINSKSVTSADVQANVSRNPSSPNANSNSNPNSSVNITTNNNTGSNTQNLSSNQSSASAKSFSDDLNKADIKTNKDKIALSGQRGKRTPSAAVLAGGTAANSGQAASYSAQASNDNVSVSQNNAYPDDVFAMELINSELPLPGQTLDIQRSYSANPSGNYKSGHISFQASVYGGFNYVSKTLSSSSSESQSYMQHRENEENNIITPAFGVSLTASMSKFALSLGAEYSVYGEETNYYPYSLQQSVVQNSQWNFYNVQYTDTDTAFFIGNRYFIQTQQTRIDSTYDTHTDTVEAYQYDQSIAEKNGVNHISYIEVPVMVSYNLISGRAGLGISAGVAPGWLTSRSGYYLKTDGKGVESLEEIPAFRKFMMNGRVGIDLYYRINGRVCLNLRPQFKANLNSVFEDNYDIKQKYTSTGIQFGVSWILN